MTCLHFSRLANEQWYFRDNYAHPRARARHFRKSAKRTNHRRKGNACQPDGHPKNGSDKRKRFKRGSLGNSLAGREQLRAASRNAYRGGDRAALRELAATLRAVPGAR